MNIYSFTETVINAVIDFGNVLYRRDILICLNYY